MKHRQEPSPITCLFVDIGGVLLTNGWDHLARKRAAKHFNLGWAEMDERHRLNFEVHEEGKLAFEDYLTRVVFYQKRPFTRAQFRSFMCAQSKPHPEMIALISQLKARHGLEDCRCEQRIARTQRLSDSRIQANALCRFLHLLLLRPSAQA